MDANEFQRLAMRTLNPRLVDGDMQMMYAVPKLAEECGEIAALYTKVWQGHPLDLNKLQKEVGDVAWVLAAICHAAGFKLGDAMEGCIDKLIERYPDGFSEERSRNRTD